MKIKRFNEKWTELKLKNILNNQNNMRKEYDKVSYLLNDFLKFEGFNSKKIINWWFDKDDDLVFDDESVYNAFLFKDQFNNFLIFMNDPELYKDIKNFNL